MSEDNQSSSKADSGTTTPAPAAKQMPTFTDKEEMVLKMAWQCLKSGPPEIDIAKLQELAGFNTQKTAQNTWGVIRKKLMSMAPPTAAGEDGGAATHKPKATPKKRGKKAAEAAADGDNAAVTGSPAKKARTPRKAATPKSTVKVEAEDAEEEWRNF